MSAAHCTADSQSVAPRRTTNARIIISSQENIADDVLTDSKQEGRIGCPSIVTEFPNSTSSDPYTTFRGILQDSLRKLCMAHTRSRKLCQPLMNEGFIGRWNFCE